MGDEERERLAKIETHVEYIRKNIDSWGMLCNEHRIPIEERIEKEELEMRRIKMVMGVLLGLVIGIVGKELGLVKIIIGAIS